MIRRVEFDALLVSLATDAGAELIGGVDIVQARQQDGHVTLVARDGRRFESSVVVAADGVHSVVARRLGLNPGWPAARVALDMMEETPRSRLRDLDPSTLWVAYGYRPGTPTRGDGAEADVAEGYAYIFPKRHHVNIGVGYVLQYYRDRVDAAPYELQRGFVDRLRARGIVAGESAREHFTPYLIPVGGPLRRPGRGGVLLAGDAGGFVNGFTAEGIYYAMVSGELAARAIVGAAGRIDRMAPAYAAACARDIGAELRDSVLIQRYLFGHSARVRAVIEGARRERALVRLILEFAVGRRSYRDLRRRIFARAPSFAVRMAWELLRRRPAPSDQTVTVLK
jgi:flavin-dependent dehydrogenase